MNFVFNLYNIIFFFRSKLIVELGFIFIFMLDNDLKVNI